MCVFTVPDHCAAILSDFSVEGVREMVNALPPLPAPNVSLRKYIIISAQTNERGKCE